MVKRARSTRNTARGARGHSPRRGGLLAAALGWLTAASACQLIGGIEEKVLVPAGGGGGEGGAATTSVTGVGGAGAGGSGGGAPVNPSCRGKEDEGITRPVNATYGQFLANPGEDTFRDVVFEPPRIVLAGTEGGSIYIRRTSTESLPNLNWELHLTPGKAEVATAEDKIFVGGTFTEALTIPGCQPLALTTGSTSAIFVAELDDTNAGQCVWARAIQSNLAPRANAIAADSEGATYLTGELSGTATPPGGDCGVTGFHGDNLFLAKFHPMGACAWVQSGGVSQTPGQRATTVAVRSDPGGFVVAGGAYLAVEENNVAFTGGTPLLDVGGLNAFLVSYDLAGNYRWSRSFGGESDDQISGVAIDTQGNVIAAGHYQETFDINADVEGLACELPEPNSQGALVVKLDTNGEVLWARGFGGRAFADGIAVDRAGAVFITGSFRDFIDFGGGPIGAATDLWSVFIAKLDSDGRHVWSTSIPNSAPGPDGDFANTAAVSGAMLLVGGHFQGTAEFAGVIGSLTSAGNDGFLIGLAP